MINNCIGMIIVGMITTVLGMMIIEWASARVPPTPLFGGPAERGREIDGWMDGWMDGWIDR